MVIIIFAILGFSVLVNRLELKARRLVFIENLWWSKHNESNPTTIWTDALLWVFMVYTTHTSKFNCCGHVHLLCILYVPYSFYSLETPVFPILINRCGTALILVTCIKYTEDTDFAQCQTTICFNSSHTNSQAQSTTSIFIAMGEFLIQFNFSYTTRQSCTYASADAAAATGGGCIEM